METPASSPRGAFIAKLGAWLQLAPVVGLIGTVIGMTHAFQTIDAQSGAGDPVKLSGAIGEVLVATLIGMTLSIVGLILVAIAITILGYRARWMFQFLCFYGLLVLGLSLCLLFLGHFVTSLHLLFGIFFLAFALAKKAEFQRAALAQHKLPSCYKLDD